MLAQVFPLNACYLQIIRSPKITFLGNVFVLASKFASPFGLSGQSCMYSSST